MMPPGHHTTGSTRGIVDIVCKLAAKTVLEPPPRTLHHQHYHSSCACAEESLLSVQLSGVPSMRYGRAGTNEIKPYSY